MTTYHWQDWLQGLHWSTQLGLVMGLLWFAHHEIQDRRAERDAEREEQQPDDQPPRESSRVTWETDEAEAMAVATIHAGA